jgi:alkylation response protein AidB-like acyl-CoA dehydrogenase
VTGPEPGSIHAKALLPPRDAAAILANARAIAPRIRERADAIEAERRLPDDVYADLAGSGAVRMAMPRAWGGPELSPLEQIDVIEVLAHADASVGWCASILSDCGFYAGFLDEAVGRRLFANLDAGCAGMLLPVGRAEIVDGGYQLSGHWAFGSGCRHAAWFTGGCVLTRGGRVLMGANGLPESRVLIFPPEAVEILDTWDVTGLAGSGSHDYRVEDVFVPREHSFDVMQRPRRSEPLYRYHGLFFANVPGVPLGLARRALDEVSILAGEKRVPPGMRLLKSESRVQTALAEAEAILGSARSYCTDVMGELWESLCRGDTPSLELRARLALMIIHTGRSAQRVVDLACEIAGSSALYRRSPLERLRRDMIAVSSHVVHQAKTYRTIGRVLLGLDPGPVFF